MVQVDDIPPEHHALVPSYMGANSGGKRIHPLPFSDPAFPGNRNVLTSPISQLTYTQIYSPLSAGLKLNIYLVPFFAVQPRSMDPSKDLAAYGYGSVAWKERMESWKQKQEKLQMMKHENGGKDSDYDGNGPDLPL